MYIDTDSFLKPITPSSTPLTGSVTIIIRSFVFKTLKVYGDDSRWTLRCRSSQCVFPTLVKMCNVTLQSIQPNKNSNHVDKY